MLATMIILALACKDQPKEIETVAPKQGVKGVVTFTPGVNNLGLVNQDDRTGPEPQPLAGATVYLLGADSISGRWTFVDSTTTDSTGHYMLAAPSGRYYVGAGKDSVAAPVLVSLPGDSIPTDRIIQALAGLEVLEGYFTPQPLNIAALSLQ